MRLPPSCRRCGRPQIRSTATNRALAVRRQNLLRRWQLPARHAHRAARAALGSWRRLWRAATAALPARCNLKARFFGAVRGIAARAWRRRSGRRGLLNVRLCGRQLERGLRQWPIAAAGRRRLPIPLSNFTTSAWRFWSSKNRSRRPAGSHRRCPAQARRGNAFPLPPPARARRRPRPCGSAARGGCLGLGDIERTLQRRKAGFQLAAVRSREPDAGAE